MVVQMVDDVLRLKGGGGRTATPVEELLGG